MQRFANWVLWIVVALMAALSILNWSTLMMPAPIDLLILRIEAPLGGILVGLTGVLVVLFFIASLRNQIGALLEANRLNKEVQRLQTIEDEAIRRELASLREQVNNEFDYLKHRLQDSKATVASTGLDITPQ